MTQLLKVPYRATYARLAGPGAGTEWPRVAVRLADGAGREEEAEAWYRSLVGSVGTQPGRALTAYTLVDGSPAPPRFLEILGTTDDSAEEAYAALQAQLDDKTLTRGASLIRQRSIGFFDRVFSYSPSSTARSVARP